VKDVTPDTTKPELFLYATAAANEKVDAIVIIPAREKERSKAILPTRTMS
jgi:hypothetical protein